MIVVEWVKGQSSIQNNNGETSKQEVNKEGSSCVDTDEIHSNKIWESAG